MPGLPAVGKLSYNGYTFDGTAKVKVTSEPVRDEADRTVICTKITISVEAIVTGPTNDVTGTNNTMENIRTRLSHDGQALYFENKGFSKPLKINTGGKVKDVKFGPKVQVLQWEPVGSRLACAIKWQVVTHIPACGSDAKYKGRMALNYSIAFAISERGATTRTIAGYIEIAMTREGMKIPDVSDAYRHTFSQHAPAGFKRTHNFTIDKSKARLDFTVVDTEIVSPNAFPAGIINITGNARVSRSIRDLIPRTVMSVTIERDKSVSGTETYAIFSAIVLQRIEEARRLTGRAVILESVTADEEIFGYTSTFSCSWRTLTDAGTLIAASGLWTPLGTDWGTWRSSLQHSMFNQRGTAGLYVSSGEDAIIDLCGNRDFPVGQENTGLQENTFGGYTFTGYILENQKPPPDQSYLNYQCYLRTKKHQPFARLKPLQARPRGQDNGNDNRNQLLDDPPRAAKRNTVDDAIQIGVGASHSAELFGVATRVGYETPAPALKSVGSQNVLEMDSVLQTNQVGNFMGVPVYQTFWGIGYEMVNSPGAIETPGNIQNEDAG